MRFSLPARIARSCTVSLVALAMLAAIVPPRHGPDDGHGHAPLAPTEAHTAGFEMHAVWMLLVTGWNALRGQQEICQDCNLPVDQGCQCVCYSGGYDPSDPSC